MLRKLGLGLFFCWFLLWEAGVGSAMSLNVQDAEVAGLLRSVAKMENINLILDESVQGKVSLKLEDVEPQVVLQQVIKARGLGVTKDNNTWVVAAPEVLGRNYAKVAVIPVEYAQLATAKAAADMYLQKNNKSKTKDNTSKKSAKASEEKIITEANSNSRIMTDPATSSLVVCGTPEEVAEIARLIGALDVPTQQIALEAKVISINKEDISKLGVNWEWSTLPQYVYNDDGAARPSLGGGVPGGIISFGQGPGGLPYELQYSAKLEALLTQGKADILSRPNIITLQGEEATINIGGEVPVPTVSVTNSTTTTSIEYKPAGIILRCRSRVNKDGFITSRIHTEVSSPVFVEAMNAYSFQKRSADTLVRLKDGETMVIGGLISSEDSETINKIPLLGDLPIIGHFFKNVRKTKTNSEIIIVIKAKIIP